MNVDTDVILLAVLVMALASTVQAAVGFGANMLAAPVLALLDPDLVPGPIFVAAAVLTVATALREPDDIDWAVVRNATAGRIPVEGVVPLCESFDTVGPLCRSVEDASLMLAALEGGRAADLRGARLEGKRLMVLETLALDDLRAAPAAAFTSAVERLQDAGAVIVRGEIPEVATAMPLSPVLFAGEAYGTWRDEIEAMPELMYTEILERFRAGTRFTAPDFVAAWRKLRLLREGWLARTAGVDAVILATSPILPPDIERLERDHEYYVSENMLALRNTRMGNLFGLSALSLPTGVPSCGIMFFGQPMREEQLLRLGAAAEKALG